MTTTSGRGAGRPRSGRRSPGHLLARSSQSSRSSSTAPVVVGVLGALALAAVLSALTLVVAVIDQPSAVGQTWPVALVGVVGGGVAWRERSRLMHPSRTMGVTVLNGAVVAWICMALISTFVYVATGAISNVGDALFESVAGVTTTNLSAVPDIEALSRPMLFWRAGTQWLGGFAALIVGLIILPFWVHDREVRDLHSRGGAFKAIVPTPLVGLRNLGRWYVGFTAVAWLALGLAGMGVFDGLTYGMTSVSSGGFGNHPDSLAWFDSALVEWVAAVLMAVVGLSVPLMWWVLQGSFRPFFRSIEVRWYLTAITGASVLFWWAGTHPDGATGSSSGHLRDGAVTATSALSTTGFWSADWGAWSWGAPTILLLLVITGSMSGSVGAGFRWLRVIEVVKFLRRELTLQVHPHARVAVKVSGQIASERSLGQMNAHHVLVLVSIITGSLLLATSGLDVLTAVAASSSAISTFGPSLGDLAATDAAWTTGADTRVVLMVLMLAGRLSVYPMLLAIGSLGLWMRRRAEAARLSTRTRG